MKYIILFCGILGSLCAFGQQNTFPTSGSVGIGTTNPSTKLDVQSQNAANFGTSPTCCAANYTIAISEATNINTRLPSIQFHTSGSQEAFLRLASDSRVFEIGDNQAVGVDFAIRNVANTARNVLISGRGNTFFNGGNVGIGTATPNAPLQFASSTANRKIVMWEEGNNDNQFYGFGINPGALRYQVSNGANHVFYASTSSTSSNELFRIQSNGNVGIGNVNPAYRLSVNGTLYSNKATFVGQNPGANFTDGAIEVREVNTVGTGQTSDNYAPRVTFHWGMVASKSIALGRNGNLKFNNQNDINSYANIEVGDIISSGNMAMKGTIESRYYSVPINGGIYIQKNADTTTAHLNFNDNSNGRVTAIRRLVSGEGNNGLGYYGFYNGTWTNILAMKDDGKVGIGTVSPQSSLHVSSASNSLGAIRVEANAASLQASISFSDRNIYKFALGKQVDNSFFIYDNTNAKDVFRVSTDGQVILQPINGNVGIGTTNPIYKLHTVGQNYVAGPTSGYVFEDRSNPMKAFQWYADGGSAGLYNQATSTQPLTISPTGNLGIATTNPTQRLDVFGAINVHTHVISQNSGFISSGQTWLAPNPSGKKRFYMDIVSDNYARLGTYNEVDGTSFNLAINPYGGNVGIGTISPTQKVEIVGNTYVNAENSGFVVDAANLSRVGLMKYYGIEAALVHGNQTPLRFGQVNQVSVLGGTFTEQMRIDNNGNVGIGTVSPSRKLHVISNSGIGVSDVAQNGITSLFTDGTTTSLDCYSGANSNFIVRTNLAGSGSTEKFRINSSGQVIIGVPTVATLPADYKLLVAGNVIAEKVKVKKQSSGWPDYVFSPNYKLPNLTEVESFIKQNSHLPEIPSAAEIEKEGQDLGEMNRLLLKKVEELTLYIINQEKKIIVQEQEVLILKKRDNEIEILKKELAVIKKILTQK